MLRGPDSFSAWTSILMQVIGTTLLVLGTLHAYRKLVKAEREARERFDSEGGDRLTAHEFDNFKGWLGGFLAAREVEQVKGQVITAVAGAVLTTAGSVLSTFIA